MLIQQIILSKCGLIVSEPCHNLIHSHNSTVDEMTKCLGCPFWYHLYGDVWVNDLLKIFITQKYLITGDIVSLSIVSLSIALGFYFF